MYYEVKKYEARCDSCQQSCTFETMDDPETCLLGAGWAVYLYFEFYTGGRLICPICTEKQT